MTESKKKEHKKPKKECMDIHAAFLQVMEEVAYVQKTGTMDFGKTKYSYVGETDLIKAVRPSLVKAGITFYCEKIDIVDSEDFIVEKVWDGKTTKTLNHRFLAIYTFIFTHVKSKTQIKTQAVGDGMDVGDKSAYKAATGGLKYALRQTALLETGDDPDIVASQQQAEGYQSKAEVANNSSPLTKKHFATISNDLYECDTVEDLSETFSEHKRLFGRFEYEKPDDYQALLDIGASIRRGFDREA